MPPPAFDPVTPLTGRELALSPSSHVPSHLAERVPPPVPGPVVSLSTGEPMRRAPSRISMGEARVPHPVPCLVALLLAWEPGQPALLPLPIQEGLMPCQVLSRFAPRLTGELGRSAFRAALEHSSLSVVLPVFYPTALPSTGEPMLSILSPVLSHRVPELHLVLALAVLLSVEEPMPPTPSPAL